MEEKTTTEVEKPATGPGTMIVSDEEILEVDAAAELLAKQHSVSKVHPVIMVQEVTFKRVVAFLKEPNFSTKVYMMQQAARLGAWPAAEELMSLIIIKDASDPLTYGDSSECDPYKLCVARRCISIIEIMVDMHSKKK